MFKLFFGLAVLALCVERASAFSLKGPFEGYQDAVIGYFGADAGGPHNWGEEYRRNAPVVFYTFDQSFYDYFGSNGVAAVEEAFAILNGVPKVSTMSSDLSEFPLESQSINFKAQALDLTDIKSFFLMAMMEQMGLAEPERFVWTLHDRQTGNSPCPLTMSYFTVKRNFDPVFTQVDELQPVSYVNGTLYSYQIVEFCTGPNPLADAVEFPVDPSANAFSSVAGLNLVPGGYLTALTRDDIGGLRYLLRSNNWNIETSGTNTLTVFTNTSVNQLLFTSNLTLLINQSLTNDAAALQALYPNLVISSTTPIFTNVVSTNVFFYLTNYPWLPAGTVMVAFQTNRTTNVVTWFSHTFANVITNSYYTKGFVTILTTNVSSAACGPYAPANSPPCTQVTVSTVFTNFINGDYYILPTNSDCGVSIVSTQLTSVITVTNDAVVATNAPGTTNLNNSGFSQSLIFYFTNRAFVIHPIPCITNLVERREGIEHVQFIRYDGAYDSLNDVYNLPVTNEYQLISRPFTNPIATPRKVIRAIRRPDIIITAMDLTTEVDVPATKRGGAETITGFANLIYQRNVPWVNTAIPGLFGPGTIDPDVAMTVNKVGPIFLNLSLFSLDELTHIHLFTWGSFDGSTNNPVVYPNGTSTLNYEKSLFIHTEPNYMPQGFLTSTVLHTNFFQQTLSVVSYSADFTPPVTWTIAPGSLGLPPGLNLATTSSNTAAISGFPTAVGTYDFTLRLTDSQSRVFDRTYFIKINQ